MFYFVTWWQQISKHFPVNVALLLTISHVMESSEWPGMTSQHWRLAEIHCANLYYALCLHVFTYFVIFSLWSCNYRQSFTEAVNKHNLWIDLTCMSNPNPFYNIFSAQVTFTVYRYHLLAPGFWFPWLFIKVLSVRCILFGTISLPRFLFAAFGKTLPLACHRKLTGNCLRLKIEGHYLF